MRGFPMNLSPGGLEDGPGFPYFADGKFEFGGYGGPPFHPHDAAFFPGHHPGGGPGGQGLPFSQGGEFFMLSVRKKVGVHHWVLNQKYLK